MVECVSLNVFGGLTFSYIHVEDAYVLILYALTKNTLFYIFKSYMYKYTYATVTNLHNNISYIVMFIYNLFLKKKKPLIIIEKSMEYMNFKYTLTLIYILYINLILQS